jgi:transposase, IS30 family
MTKKQKSVNKRRFNRLSYKERVIIENRYCVDKKTVSIIALELSRPVSAVSREIGGKPRIGRGKYSADIAQAKAINNSKKQGRKSKLGYEPLSCYVVEKLKLGWSPEQIESRLPIEYPRDRKMRISYEAIYQYVYAQIRREGNGRVKKGCEDLRKYLARRHKRRAKKGFRKAQKLERKDKLPSIEDRPKEADKRKEIGHWEDDTMVSRQSLIRIKSINERASGVVFLGKMVNGTNEESTRVVCEKLRSIPSPYLKTLTRDRGTENMGWENIEKTLSLSVYFAHSYCSYERGSNENLNGLVRRFFPKKTDFAEVSDEEIRRVEYLLNTRPRKRFGGLTPLEVLFKKTGVVIEY